MTSGPLLVLCTCPDRATAQVISRAVVSEAAAACVNILPGVSSIYRWQDELREDSEWLLLIKTTGAAYARLEALISELHPYELPEIIAVSVVDGSPEYLRWVARASQQEP